MKILVFYPYYPPEIAASLYLYQDIVERLAKEGNVVDLFVPSPTRGISKEIKSEYKHKKLEILYNGNLRIHRFSCIQEGKNPILRAIRYFWTNLIYLWKGLLLKSDVLFTLSTPPTQGLVFGFLKKIKSIPVVYNLQDIFPDSLVNSGLTNKGSIFWKIGRKIEDFTYRNADKIIVISEDFKKNIMAKGVPEEKIEVIPNWVDTSDVYPIDRKDNILFDRYNIDRNKFIISYCGNIGHTQNMDMLLDAAKELQENLPQLLFVLIGEGAEKQHVEERINNEHITNVLLLPFQPYEDIAHVFSLGDVGLIISKPGVGTNSVPSKTWSYMAAGKPILASFDEDSELHNIIIKNHCGFISSNTSFGSFIDCIQELYKMTNLKNLGDNGYNYISSSLSRDNLLNKYIEIFMNC